MSEHTRIVEPLVVAANATLADIAALVSSEEAAMKRRGRRPVEWVVLRATSGFTVSWYLLRFDDLERNTREPFDAARTIADAVVLSAHTPIPSVQLGEEDTVRGPRLILTGRVVYGLVPPELMAAQGPGSGRRGDSGATPEATGVPGLETLVRPDAAVPAPATTAAPAMRLDAAAYVNSPRKVIQQKRFTLEIGLAPTPDPTGIGGKVQIDFQEGEHEIPLDVHLQCEGFTCADGTDYTLLIPRKDPFTPRLTVELASTGLADGVADELRAIQIVFSVRGLIRGVATWRILVQRVEAAVDVPDEPPSHVAIDPSSPSIDLTLTCTWKDATPASQTLCWSYSTPHAIPKPAGKLVRSSPELATLPLGIVDELAQGDGLDGIELLMGGIAARIATEIPAGVWEVIRSVTDAVHAARGPDAVPTILIVTEEYRVPWELAMLPENRFPADPAAPELRLLGTEYIVSRWVLDDALPPLPPHRIAAKDVVAVYGDYSSTGQAQLPYAKQEAEYLETQRQGIRFTADRATIINILKSAQTTPAGAALAPKVLHFAGHGEAARQGTPSSFIVLNDGSNLSSLYFRNAAALRNHRPLVFLNACQLGAGVATLAQPGGFAADLVRAQCSVVIAPLWSVNDQVAYDVATHFYDAVLAGGQSPAAAMRQARQPRYTDLALSDPGTGAPIARRTASRLAYIVYGHPAMTFGS